MMGDKDDKTSSAKALTPGVSLIITVGALGLMTLHLLADESPVDGVAIGLFVLAVAPWLAPLLSKLELPGGWKFEFKELRREVTEEIQEGTRKVESLASRLQNIEQFAFTGALSGAQQERLNEGLSAYDRYLRSIGLRVDDATPEVHIDEGFYDNAHYDPSTRRIVIGQDFVEDHDVVFREYTHHVLVTQPPEGDGRLEVSLYAIESGLADYYPCSFKNSPVFGPRVGSPCGKSGNWISPTSVTCATD